MSVQNLTMIVSDNKKSVHEFGSLQHYCILSQVKLQILVLQLNVIQCMLKQKIIIYYYG